MEDSYLKNYNKKSTTTDSNPRAYELKGRKIRLGAISAIHQIIDLEELKQESKKYEATVTQYLTAVLIYSIYKANKKQILNIRICLISKWCPVCDLNA